MNDPESLSSKELLDLYYFMRLNRTLEDRLIALYRQSPITATVFTSRGQEATSVGSAWALGPADYVSPITRNLGTMLVRGIPPRDIFTQYMGKGTSPTKGKERIHYFGDMNKGVVASVMRPWRHDSGDGRNCPCSTDEGRLFGRIDLHRRGRFGDRRFP